MLQSLIPTYLRHDNNIKKAIMIILAIIISCTLGGCLNKRDKLYQHSIKLPTRGNYKLVQASKDGCDTAHSSRGNSFQRTFYTFRQDPFFLNDAAYYDAWFRGYIYCFHLVTRNAFTGIDSRFSDTTNLDFSPSKIPFLWDYAGGITIPNQGEGGVPMFGYGESTWDSLFVTPCKTKAVLLPC